MPDKNVDRLKDALHIDREPFSEDGVTGLFYPGGGRQDLLDQLTHLTRYGSPLLVLIGENGVGKSTLLSQLVSGLEPAVYKTLHIDADILADEHFILSRMAEGYGLDLGDHSDTAINVLVRFAKELDSYSQTPLLVIDSGQNLSSEAVSLLQLILSHAGASGFRCLVAFDGDAVTDVPLLGSLVSSGFDYQEVKVPPLDKVACEEYLAYRMTTSGLGSIQFNRDQIEQIFNHSQGNPDKANIIARQLLVESFPYKKNQRKKTFKFPLLPFSGVVVLVALLLATHWFDGGDEVEAIQASEVVEEPMPDLPELASVEMDGHDSQSSEPIINLDSNEDSAGVADVEKQLDSFVTAEVDYNYEESEPQEVLAPVLEKEKAKDDKVVKVAVEQISPKPALSEAKVAGPPGETVEKKPVVEPPTPPYTQREQWLLSLDKSKYTLQMLGANEKSTVQKYLSKYPSLKELAYYKTKRKTKDWYVVVYGQYSSKESAKLHLGKLPKSIRQTKPWPRTLASVQDDIRSANK